MMEGSPHDGDSDMYGWWWKVMGPLNGDDAMVWVILIIC